MHLCHKLAKERQSKCRISELTRLTTIIRSSHPRLLMRKYRVYILSTMKTLEMTTWNHITPLRMGPKSDGLPIVVDVVLNASG